MAKKAWKKDENNNSIVDEDQSFSINKDMILVRRPTKEDDQTNTDWG